MYIDPKTRDIISYVLCVIAGLLGTLLLLYCIGPWYVDYLRHVM